jgi:LysM repeat protein
MGSSNRRLLLLAPLVPLTLAAFYLVFTAGPRSPLAALEGGPLAPMVPTLLRPASVEPDAPGGKPGQPRIPGGEDSAWVTATPRPHPTAVPATAAPPEQPPVPPEQPQRAAAQPVMVTITVEAGDTLSALAERYQLTVDELMALNGLRSTLLTVGQQLVAPIPESHVGPAVALIPDGELVYGPGVIGFDVYAFAQEQPGYLKSHSEVVEDRIIMTGPQIVQLVAQRYSVNPRLLLAVLEYRSRWLSNPNPSEQERVYAAGKVDEEYDSLFEQLNWVANRLNKGYYGWKERELTTVGFGDESQAYLAAGLNAGTAGLQHFLALESDWPTWQSASGPGGFIQTYRALFGDPWARGTAPAVPAGLVQPEFRLPWAPGDTWYLTGGPHGGWGGGSSWASLDFVADPKPIGCGTSPYWVTAISSGLVLRSDNGEVIIDLDGDGYEQTGWVVFYMHMAADGRVPVGAYVNAGDRIGHPSCEGGYSTGAHLHIARRFNGEWISATGAVPFVLDGWTPVLGRYEYDGSLAREGQVVPACVCRNGNSVTAR